MHCSLALINVLFLIILSMIRAFTTVTFSRIYIILYLIRVYSCIADTIWFGTMYNYIYYKQKVSWGEARWVCQSLGGDLAKIDSAEDRDNIVALATKYYGIGIL